MRSREIYMRMSDEGISRRTAENTKKVEEIILPSKEQDEEGKTVKQTIYIFPPEWAGTFGKPITSIAQVGILQQEHYSGNWDVLRPAAEIEEMNTFTADGLNALLHEAEKIMEGWTDTDE